MAQRETALAWFEKARALEGDKGVTRGFSRRWKPA
jgi:hypothetical protein